MNQQWQRNVDSYQIIPLAHSDLGQLFIEGMLIHFNLLG